MRPLIIVLSEASLPRLLWALLRRRTVYVVSLRAALPGTAPLLSRLHRHLHDRGMLAAAPSNVPELLFAGAFRFEAFTRIFIEAERWMRQRFAFSKLAGDLGDYDQAYRHVVFGHVDSWCRGVIRADALLSCFPDAEFVVDDCTFELLRTWTKGAPPGVTSQTRWQGPGRAAGNFLQFLAAVAYAAIILAGRTRMWPRAATHNLLGATFVSDPRHYGMIREIIDSEDQIRTIFLTKEDARVHATDSDGFRDFCAVDDGTFTPAQALTGFWMAARDLLQLWWKLSSLLPLPVFRGMSGLVLRRLVWRGLFNRHRFDFVLGRDDYNAEHIMRGLELRRIGGKSLGINHGLPISDLIEPGWRYLDFDIYYIFGRHLYDRYYQDTWPSGMQVRPVGSFGMTRNRQARLALPRPPNFVYFVNPGPFEQEQALLVLEVARRFRDRTFWVKIKPSRKKQGYCNTTVALLLENGPANIVSTDDDTYELMLRCCYALVGLSTVGAEAVQFGLVTFALDNQPEENPNYYRDFGGLCVRSADQVEDRVRRIERGDSQYDPSVYEALISMNSESIFDRIRADLGLPAKRLETPPLSTSVLL